MASFFQNKIQNRNRRFHLSVTSAWRVPLVLAAAATLVSCRPAAGHQNGDSTADTVRDNDTLADNVHCKAGEAKCLPVRVLRNDGDDTSQRESYIPTYVLWFGDYWKRAETQETKKVITDFIHGVSDSKYLQIVGTYEGYSTWSKTNFGSASSTLQLLQEQSYVPTGYAPIQSFCRNELGTFADYNCKLTDRSLGQLMDATLPDPDAEPNEKQLPFDPDGMYLIYLAPETVLDGMCESRCSTHLYSTPKQHRVRYAVLGHPASCDTESANDPARCNDPNWPHPNSHYTDTASNTDNGDSGKKDITQYADLLVNETAAQIANLITDPNGPKSGYYKENTTSNRNGGGIAHLCAKKLPDELSDKGTEAWDLDLSSTKKEGTSYTHFAVQELAVNREDPSSTDSNTDAKKEYVCAMEVTPPKAPPFSTTGETLHGKIPVYTIYFEDSSLTSGGWPLSTRAILNDFVSNVGGTPYLDIVHMFSGDDPASMSTAASSSNVIFAGDQIFKASATSPDNRIYNPTYEGFSFKSFDDIDSFVTSYLLSSNPSESQLPLDPSALYLLFLGPNTGFPGMCESRCSNHRYVSSQGIKYAVLGHPGYCAKHADPIDTADGTIPAIADNAHCNDSNWPKPNGEVYTDLIVNEAAVQLANMITDPKGDGYFPDNTTPDQNGGGIANLCWKKLPEILHGTQPNQWDVNFSDTQKPDTSHVHFALQELFVNKYNGDKAGYCALTSTTDSNADSAAYSSSSSSPAAHSSNP